MTVDQSPSTWVVTRLALAGLLFTLTLAGCQKNEPAPPPEEDTKSASTQGDSGKKVTGPAAEPRLHQSFAEATRAEPPPDYPIPPGKTLAGKSVGKLYTEVKATWDTIHFTSPEGKRLNYRAVLDTDQGEIEITFLPEVAPNHVRSFLALAKIGYFDGLCFERTMAEKLGPMPEDPALHVVEGGCPEGLGNLGKGSIGYWLKPEFSAQALHEPGAIGACRGEELDSAACRFYILLDKVPPLDGKYTVFARVTRGLDIARKIFELPVIQNDDFPEGDRPVKPVTIRKVAIHSAEVDNSPAKLENK